MTVKTLANSLVNANLPAGANSQVFGTLYTVPAGKTALIKEIRIIGRSNASNGVGDIYILPTGVTDLTAVGADTLLPMRADDEGKNAIYVGTFVWKLTLVAGDLTTLALNLVLNAGDSLKAWVHYGAVTPADTNIFVIVSGVEF